MNLGVVTCFRIAIIVLLMFIGVVRTTQAQTTAQLLALKTAIAVSADLVQAGTPDCGGFVGVAVNAVPNTPDGNQCLSRVYALAASPAFTVWKTSVTITQIGDNIVATEIAGLSSLNATRLQTIVQLSGDGINPSLADRRAFFDDIFSGAGGVGTKAKLLILYKRLANRFERIYATGTGSDAVPATLVLEGTVSASVIDTARNLP